MTNNGNIPFAGSSYTDIGFANYLQNPTELFTIDLSNATLLDAMCKMFEIKDRISPCYSRHFQCLMHHLRCIQEDFKCILMPGHITDIFWSNFIPYLIKRGLALSTIKTCCSQLKTSVEWAGKHGAKISDSYDMVKTPSYAHQQIALTPDEISHIFHFNVDSIGRRSQYRRNMEKVRDMFVLSCNLGQRYGDMLRIDKGCFDRNIFTILQQKTGVKARVDIEKMSIDRNTTYRILDKYAFRAPTMTQIGTYDHYLKELLQYVGGEFLEEVKQETKINGYVETKLIPKWKLVGSHTARRSFITNNVLRGYRPLEIMRASGHKTYSSFEKYLCYFEE